MSIIIKKLISYFTNEIALTLIWAVFAFILSNFLKKYWDFEVWKTHSDVGTLIKDAGVLGTFWFIVLKMPFIEEMAFRFFLNLKWQNIAIGTFFMTYFNLGIFFQNIQILYRFFISILVFIVVFLVLYSQESNLNIQISKKKTQLIQGISIGLFGLYHITNFIPIEIKFWYIYPFYIIPQLISGYFLTKIRLEFGIIWAIFYHIVNNLIPFTFQVLSSV